MQLGVIFPQTEIGADPTGVRDFAQAAEELGYAHLIVFDHVLGADTTHYKNWGGAYALGDMFHEPFVLYGYLAALTQKLELVTAVIILGQRQTALVAKQAAAVDVLSGGRLRLGVGIGWNAVEYEALNENFHDRGKRSEEQIALLRALWTQEVVDFHGRWHNITHAGINPLPVQRPIPLWLGGASKPWSSGSDGWRTAGSRSLRRTMPDARPSNACTVMPAPPGATLRRSASRGVSASPKAARTPGAGWPKPGAVLDATHLSVNTMRAGLVHAGRPHRRYPTVS